MLYVLGAVCGYLAAITQVIAFGWYGWYLVQGAVDTNPLSWYLWLGETFVGLLIYADRTRDSSKYVGEVAALIGVICVTSFLTYQAWWQGTSDQIFSSVQFPDDIISTVIAIFAFVLWLDKRSTWGAGVVVWFFQIALLCAAYPLIRAAYVDPSAEPFGPWALWALAFILQFGAACLRWDGVTPLLNPINYAITHAAVAVIVWQGAVN